MRDGGSEGQRLLKLVSREAEEEGVVMGRRAVGMKGNMVTSGHLLSCVSPSNVRVHSAFFQDPLQDKEGRKKAPIKKIQREMYFTCIALFPLSSQMECLLKKPISLTTVLKGSKRALQQTAATLTLHPLSRPCSRCLLASAAQQAWLMSLPGVFFFFFFKERGFFPPPRSASLSEILNSLLQVRLGLMALACRH